MSNTTGDDAMHMMKMYFNYDMNIHVLFEEWIIATAAQMVGSCIGSVLLAVLYEALKVLRAYLLVVGKPKTTYCTKKNPDAKPPKKLDLQRFNKWHILQSFLQIIHTTLGMWLMLIYMTYNIHLIIWITLGSGLGYLIFAWMVPTTTDNDPCN